MGYKGAVRVFEINREAGATRGSFSRCSSPKSHRADLAPSPFNRVRGAPLHHHPFWIKSNSRCLVRPRPVHRYWPRERNSQPVGYGALRSSFRARSFASMVVVGDEEISVRIEDRADLFLARRTESSSTRRRTEHTRSSSPTCRCRPMAPTSSLLPRTRAQR